MGMRQNQLGRHPWWSSIEMWSRLQWRGKEELHPKGISKEIITKLDLLSSRSLLGWANSTEVGVDPAYFAQVQSEVDHSLGATHPTSGNVELPAPLVGLPKPQLARPSPVTHALRSRLWTVLLSFSVHWEEPRRALEFRAAFTSCRALSGPQSSAPPRGRSLSWRRRLALTGAPRGGSGWVTAGPELTQPAAAWLRAASA